MSQLFVSTMVSVLVLVSSNAFAGNSHGKGGSKFDQKPNPISSGYTGPDAALAQAVDSQKRVDFIEAQDMKVVEVLPDDTQGLPHQKFNVQLSSRSIVTIISNLDMCPHIPVQAGDVVGAGGQFIPTGKKSGILHWVHKDPRKIRPDGYVEFKGQQFCK